jgi:hypothetical protein
LLPAAALTVVTSVLTLVICVTPVRAATPDDGALQRLATCQDSWLDWKGGSPRMTEFADLLQSRMRRQDDRGAFLPKTAMTLVGLPIEQVYPQSVGMGVGFSAIVRATLADTRRSVEAQLGKPMTCKSSAEGTGCELVVGEKKTALLMTDDPRSTRTLVGCYYFYQQ